MSVTQSTCFGDIEVGGKSDKTRSVPLSSAAKAIMAKPAKPVDDEYEAEYDERPTQSSTREADINVALHRANAIRRNAVLAFNLCSDACGAIVERMMANNKTSKKRHLLDEMHILQGAAHREGLKKAGAGAAAGNLYNRVRCTTHTTPPHKAHVTAHVTTKEKEREKKNVFFIIFFFMQMILLPYRTQTTDGLQGLLHEVDQHFRDDRRVGLKRQAELLVQFARFDV